MLSGVVPTLPGFAETVTTPALNTPVIFVQPLTLTAVPDFLSSEERLVPD